MAEKTIKHLLFSYFEEQDSPFVVDQKVLVERNARLGQKVDIPREQDVRRGEELDAFYTDDELQQIEEGTYRGPDVVLVRARMERARIIQDIEGEGPQPADEEPETNGQPGLPPGGSGGESGGEPGTVPPATGQPVAGTPSADQVRSMSDEDLAQLITERRLGVTATIALAHNDPELAEKVLDAENLVANERSTDPRSGVVRALEAQSAQR